MFQKGSSLENEKEYKFKELRIGRLKSWDVTVYFTGDGIFYE